MLNTADKQKEELIKKMLETVRTFVIDDNTALKVHNIGITDALLNLIISVDNLQPLFIAEVA